MKNFIRRKLGNKKGLVVKVTELMSHPLHCVYFGLVAIEAGHWYGIAAAGMLVVSVVEGIFHTGSNE